MRKIETIIQMLSRLLLSDSIELSAKYKAIVRIAPRITRISANSQANTINPSIVFSLLNGRIIFSFHKIPSPNYYSKFPWLIRLSLLGLKEMEKTKTFMYISKYLGKEKYVFVPIMNYLCV